MSTDWYNDPAQLRQTADTFDFKARMSRENSIASAWMGKAEALRSRADIIEKRNSLL